METKKKFNIDDIVSFRFNKDCIRHNGEKGNYYLGGIDQGGKKGTILHYIQYVEKMNCWLIGVSVDIVNQNTKCYSMLESEFFEYGKQNNNSSELFPIY